MCHRICAGEVYSSLSLIHIYGTQDRSSPYTLLNYTGYATDNNSRNMITLQLEQKVGGFFDGLTLSAQVMTDYETYLHEQRWMFPNGYLSLIHI